jgi:hypothetical protein
VNETLAAGVCHQSQSDKGKGVIGDVNEDVIRNADGPLVVVKASNPTIQGMEA